MILTEMYYYRFLGVWVLDLLLKKAAKSLLELNLKHVRCLMFFTCY